MPAADWRATLAAASRSELLVLTATLAAADNVAWVRDASGSEALAASADARAAADANTEDVYGVVGGVAVPLVRPPPPAAAAAPEVGSLPSRVLSAEVLTGLRAGDGTGLDPCAGESPL